MRRILLALALLLAPLAADAATWHCVAGTWNWSDAGGWTDGVSGGVPGSGDVAVIDAACEITIPFGTIVTVQRVRQDHASSVLDVGGKLNVSNCDDAAYYDPSDADWCGTIAGTQRVRGTVLHDTEASETSPWTGFNVYTSDLNIMQLTFAGALDGGAPAAGDWLQMTSGPDDGAAYRIASVSVGSYPTSYTVNIELKTTGGLYGTYNDSATDRLTADYFNGAPSNPEKVRVASPITTGYDASQLNRVVVVCEDGSACNTGTPADTVISAPGAWSGYFIGLATSSFSSAFSSASFRGHRYRILNTENNVVSPIDPAVASVDVLHLADPIDALDRGATLNATMQYAVVWPGFWETDEWRIMRPATIADTSGTHDGQWGVQAYLGSTPCTDWDNFFFDSFYTVISEAGDASCTNPANYGVIQSDQGGIATDLADQATGYSAGVRDGYCAGVSMIWDRYDPLTLNYVAVVDTKTPMEASAPYLGTTCCLDPSDSNGAGASCASGTGKLTTFDAGGVGTHGTRFDDVDNVTVNHSYCRFMQADCQYMATENVESATATFNDPHTWWMHQGNSASSINIAYTPAAGSVTVNVNRPSFVNYTAGTAETCPGGPSAQFKAAADSEAAPAIYHVSGGILIDVHAQQALMGTEATTARSTIDGLFAYGRDQFGAQTNCRLQKGIDSITSSWIDGWGNIGQGAPREVSRTFWRPDSTYGSALTGGPSNGTLTFEDNVFVNLPAQQIFNNPSTTNATYFRNNWFQWATMSASQGLGTWTANTSYPPVVTGNVVINRPLMSLTGCAPPAYDVSGIGLNATGTLEGVSAHQLSGIATTDCTGATPPIGLTTADLIDPRVPLTYDGVKLGPRYNVGVRSSLEPYGIRSAYRLEIGGGGSSGWLPRAY